MKVHQVIAALSLLDQDAELYVLDEDSQLYLAELGGQQPNPFVQGDKTLPCNIAWICIDLEDAA